MTNEPATIDYGARDSIEALQRAYDDLARRVVYLEKALEATKSPQFELRAGEADD